MRNSVAEAVGLMVEAYEQGGKVLTCGNGGSSADSAHIVGELVKGFMKKRPLPKELDIGMPLQMGLPAIDLTAQSALISAVANDLGGEYVYAQQVICYAGENDVLIGISTSGNALNVYNAALAAKAKGAKVIAMTGKGGGRLADVADVLLDADEKETYRVQEEHIKIYHRFCAEVEAHFFDE